MGEAVCKSRGKAVVLLGMLNSLFCCGLDWRKSCDLWESIRDTEICGNCEVCSRVSCCLFLWLLIFLQQIHTYIHSYVRMY